MKTQTTQAIILKRLNFSEADRILTVITPDKGRLSLLAKAVRRPKSKLAGGLELFSVSDITYVEGRSELKTIISTRLKNHYRNIVSDVNKTMAMYEYLKVLDEITQHGVENGLFEILKEAMAYLDEEDSSIAIANAWLVTKLLKSDGRSINTEKPANSSKFSEEDEYEFSYDDMIFIKVNQGVFTPNHIKFLRLVERSDSPKKLHMINDYEHISASLNTIFSNLLKMHKA